MLSWKPNLYHIKKKKKVLCVILQRKHYYNSLKTVGVQEFSRCVNILFYFLNTILFTIFLSSIQQKAFFDVKQCNFIHFVITLVLINHYFKKKEYSLL